MQDRLQFYIDGRWVDPVEARTCDVIDPSTEEPCARIALGSAKDVDLAVAAARKAFPSYSETSQKERVELLEACVAEYQKRYEDLARTISREMGAPIWLSKAAQAGTGLAHLSAMVEILRGYEFEELRGKNLIRREPIGVCGLITPWNWPVNQIMCKVAPALAAGCTMVLKPTEVAPLNAVIVAEILHAAGVPAGTSRPNHALTSNPATPDSCSVGTSGRACARAADVTASARTLPAWICGRAGERLSNM